MQIPHCFLLQVFGTCLWCPAVTQFFAIHQCGSWVNAAYDKLCRYPDRSPGTPRNVYLRLHIVYSYHAWCAVSCEAGPPLKLISEHFEGGGDVRCWPESLRGGRILLDHSSYSNLLLPDLPIAPMHTERLTQERRSQFSGNGWLREVRRWRNRNQTCLSKETPYEHGGRVGREPGLREWHSEPPGSEKQSCLSDALPTGSSAPSHEAVEVPPNSGTG